MRVYVVILILIYSGCILYGQQRPQFTQYMINKYYENPAYGGLERSLSIFSSFRDQYSVFPGNPRTFYVGADMPFYLWNGAVGFSMYNQRTGVFNNTNLKFSYNYVMGTSVGFLSFGGRLGIDFLNVDGSGIITPEGNYEGTFNHNDPTLENTNFNGVGPSWELGTYFMGKSVQGGLTMGELPSHSYKVGSGNYKRTLVISCFFSYLYRVSDELILKPAMLIKADPAIWQSDIGLTAEINDNLVAGFNVRGYNARSFDAIGLIIGTNLGSKYKVTYSYDFGLSAIRNVHQGTHEIMLSYNMQKLIGIGLPPKIIYNPRDL